MVPPFLQCKSHPDCALTAHLLDVARRLGAREGEPFGLLPLAGLCHDLGKATAFFQNYLLPDHDPRREPVDLQLKAHSLFGAFWFLAAAGADALPPLYGTKLIDAARHALYIQGHHGRLANLEDALSLTGEDDRCRRRLEACDADGIACWLGTQLGRERVPLPTFDAKALTRVRRAIGAALGNSLNDDEAFRFLQKCLRDFGVLIAADRDSASGRPLDGARAATHLQTSHLEVFRQKGQFGAVAREEIILAREAVYDSAIAGAVGRSNSGNIWTLQVPTGAGKTLAALGWATARRQARKTNSTIFYALPFTSIIDQTADLIRRLWPAAKIEPGAFAVHHHLADYGAALGREDVSAARDWAENWRADVVCTTFVQIVHALFHATTADARRFASLADGGILILDEAQALPAELWPTLRAAILCLSQSFGVDVLLLTATQPAILKPEDEAIDLSPSIDLGGAFNRYDVRIESTARWDAEKLVDAAVRTLNPKAENAPLSALFLLNTINEALLVYEAVRRHSMLRDWPLFHLSTNLRPKDRATILEKLRVRESAAEKRLLVSTQVVEAGVDLSFDCVFRGRAPLDAIVQAAGRCNRHGSGRRGRVIIFEFASASAHRIYGDMKMDVAACILEELGAAFPDGAIPEPAFVAKVDDFFAELARRDGAAIQKKRYVMEAVRRLEFAELRGDGFEREPQQKRVELITDDDGKVPVFVETDSDDESVWQRFLDAHLLTDLRQRRARLRAMRSDIGARVVAVPEQPQVPLVDSATGLAHVARAISATFYDRSIGWRRRSN